MQVLRPVSSHPAQGDEASLMSFSAAGLEGKCEIRAGQVGQVLQGPLRAGWWCLEDTGILPCSSTPAVKCLVFC